MLPSSERMHLDAEFPDALDATVHRCTGRTWTHYDKGKLQLCGNELALISFKQMTILPILMVLNANMNSVFQ